MEKEHPVNGEGRQEIYNRFAYIDGRRRSRVVRLEGESENDEKGKSRMEPDDEGVLRLEGGFIDDDLDSINGLLHWQMEVPIKLNDLLLTMPQLRTTIINMTPSPRVIEEAKNNKETTPAAATDPMLLALTTGRHPAVVEMGILGMVLTDTIVDGGLGVNVPPEDIWKKLGQPTLWPPTFQLLTTDQHGIKPLGTLMAQPVTIGTQPFLLDFVVIPLKRRGYNAILG